jgi:hypothetical protein
MPEPVDKQGFVLYRNYQDTVKELTDEQAGRLLKAILAHVNGSELPALGDAERIAFSFIKSQLAVDSKKYEQRCIANRENGKKGGRPKKEKTENNPENPTGFEKTETPEKKPDESVTRTKPEPEKQEKKKTTKDYTPEFEEIWKLYPRKDEKWGAFLKYEARRKNFSADQLEQAVVAYVSELKRKGTDRKFYKQMQTFFSSDKADFVRFIGQQTQQPGKQEQDSDDDWARFFTGGTQE